MPSGDLERQLGELTGVLKGLPPALERLEARVNEAEKRAATTEARYEALRKEFDEWKTKISYRFADLFKRIDNLRLENHNRKTEIEKLAENLKAYIERMLAPMGTRVTDAETWISAQKKKREGLGAKIWDVVKLLIAAAVGAGVSLLTK